MLEIFDINLISIIILLILSIVAIKLNLNTKYRFGLLIISLFYIGFYLKECICPIGAFQYLAIDYRNLFTKDNINFLLLFFIPIFVTLIWGRVYCGSVCPMGAYQELLFKLGTKLKFNKGKSSLGKFKYLTYFKYFFMVGIITFSIISGVAVFCGLDPFYALFNFQGTILSYSLLAIVTIASLLQSRLWCRIVCPYGALLGIFSKIGSTLNKSDLSLGNPKILKSCIGCNACHKNCITDAIEDKKIDSLECISCGVCKKTCKFNSIK